MLQNQLRKFMVNRMYQGEFYQSELVKILPISLKRFQERSFLQQVEEYKTLQHVIPITMILMMN
jgi:hypothetical protein